MRRLLAGLTTLLCLGGAKAEDWKPDAPVHLVVPFAVGGPTDIIARRFAESLREPLGQSVLVENRPGAGGNIAAGEVAQAAPDGRTIFLATTPQMAVNVSLYGNLTYDPLTSFEPVVLIGDLPNVLAVTPSVGARDLAGFRAYAASHPDELRFASSGNGATSHLTGVLFGRETGLDLTHVPYNGTGPALTDLMGGHVEMTFTDVLTAKPLVENGSILAVGVTTPERSDALPDVPTLDEQGLTGFDTSVAFGFLAPAGTPREIVDAFNAAIVGLMDEPDFARFLDSQGIRQPADRTPEGLRRYMEEQIPRWAELVAISGARID